MLGFKWSDSEKKLARRAFEAALATELTSVMVELKARAAAVSTPDDMWAIEDHLRARRREIEEKYDFRYSQLILVFARLVREGRLTLDQLAGLSDDKRAAIEHIAAL